MKALIYCTKEKPYLHYRPTENCNTHYVLWDKKSEEKKVLNGTICAECEIDEWDRVDYIRDIDFRGYEDGLLELACLTDEEIENYGKGKQLYALHLKNVKPVDLRLSDVNSIWAGRYDLGYPIIEKAPQSYKYVYYKGKECLLLSVNPKYVEKILNGEKTVEIRKKLPKKLKAERK